MPFELVDTHCHIQSAGASNGERTTLEKWAKVPERTPDVIVASAAEAGVTRLICVGCDLDDSRLAIKEVQNREKCWASIGLHPHEAASVLQKGHLDAFAGLVMDPKVIAVGECGLDYFYEHSPRDQQIEILKFQIELALEHDKPMIFHVREAFQDFWPVFDGYSGIQGVLHSFTDSEANMQMAIERGLHIGVNGIATFTKDKRQLEMYKKVPLSRLLLETDAPYLTPSPYRGTICEPYHIKVIAEFLGGLREEAFSDLARVTTENAARLFKI